MELLIIGLAVGGILGAKGKTVVKSAAKGYLALSERTKGWGANVRQDFQDAVEEARYEHEQELAAAELAEDGVAPAAEASAAVAVPTIASGKSPAGTAKKHATAATVNGEA